jgi:hypothetical protein
LRNAVEPFPAFWIRRSVRGLPGLEGQGGAVDRDPVDRGADDQLAYQRGGGQLPEQGGQQGVTGGQGDGLGQAGVQAAAGDGQPVSGIGDALGAELVFHPGGDVVEPGLAAQQRVEVFQRAGMAAHAPVGPVLVAASQVLHMELPATVTGCQGRRSSRLCATPEQVSGSGR